MRSTLKVRRRDGARGREGGREGGRVEVVVLWSVRRMMRNERNIGLKEGMNSPSSR